MPAKPTTSSPPASSTTLKAASPHRNKRKLNDKGNGNKPTLRRVGSGNSDPNDPNNPNNKDDRPTLVAATRGTRRV